MTAHSEAARKILASGLFDENWYRQRHPELVELGMTPIDHYLRIGALLGLNPGPGFDVAHYRATYPDIAESGADPLLHYIEYGRDEEREPLPRRPVEIGRSGERVDVVVPVYNALEDVKRCLHSLESRTDGFAVRVIVVNDASDEETGTWLREFCAPRPAFKLIEHERNRGYTQAVNTGLRLSDAPFAVTLNSDTIVTRGWLGAMVRCMRSSERIGVVGPLSNAASWQNVPALLDETGAFAVNALPPGMGPDELALLVGRVSKRLYPRLPFVNGFCFMIKRELLDAIGIMDEANFPIGYGEENDFCIRAADAGYELAIVDDAFVFHAKSKSFGHDRRKELSAQGTEKLKLKHGTEKYARLVALVKDTRVLDGVRARIVEAIGREVAGGSPIDPMGIRVLFLLPVRGGSGGAHSVVQEVMEMRRLGLQAHIGVLEQHIENFVSLYPDVPNVIELFVAYTPATLMSVAENYDIVVATIYGSMAQAKYVHDIVPHILPAYYVQDYEPMFFDEGTANWRIAHDSYALVPGALLFAKTDWIAETVRANHGVHVHRVKASIDHEVYRPAVRPLDGTVRICAMIRPQTPRRGALRTMNLLSALAAKYGPRVRIEVFGCEDDNERYLELPRDFDFTNLGVLRRPEVAALLARSDVFVDLSDYQAFGRTALEAMACGCAAVVPAAGGSGEYAVDGANTLIVDSLDEEECLRRVDALISDPALLSRLQLAGLVTASTYSVHSAAVSEIAVFAAALREHRHRHPRSDRPTVAVMPSRTRMVNNDQHPTGSGHVRIVQPYLSAVVRSKFRMLDQPSSALPEPGSADAVILQRDVAEVSLEQLQQWLPEWRAQGGRMAYEIDDDLFEVPSLRARGYEGDAAAYCAKVNWLAANADMVLVSTEPLAEKARRLNRDVRVVPNRIATNLWRVDRERDHGIGEFARSDDKVRIGYMGTPTHDRDLVLIAEAMNRIQAEYGDRVEIEVIGAYQGRQGPFGTRVGLPKRSEYPEFIAWLHKRVNWDIGLLPLEDSEFNRSKSNLKFLECGALGMAMVCSDVPSFRDVAIDGVNALVVPNDSDAWYRSVKRLIDSAELRIRLESAARELIRTRHTIEAGRNQYIGLLSALCAGDAAEVPAAKSAAAVAPPAPATAAAATHPTAA